MSKLFLTLLNMSITASWLALCVMLLRLVLKKMPKWLRVALWGLVGLRLALPFSVESALSLIPSAETISPEVLYSGSPAIHSGIPALNAAVNPIIGESFAPAVGASVNPLQIWIALASLVWLAGIAALLIYAALSYLRLHNRIKTAVQLRENIYQSENVASPFVLGFFRPRVYLPFSLSGQAMENVIAHERAHIQRRDHIIKPIGYLLLCVYWFDPLLWLAYALLCRDIELACDERVIKALGHDERADYSEALLACSVPHRLISACPLAFGEVGVKERVKNVLSYKKPAFWLIAAAVVVCVVVAVCFLTNPQSQPVSLGNMQLTWAKAMDLRPNEPVSRDLNEAQLEELKSRLLHVNAGRKDSEFGGLTAMYSLTIQAQRTPLFAIISYDVGGNKLALYYEDEYYRIDNEEFARYLSSVCAGEDTASAGTKTLSLNDVIILSQKGESLTWADFDGYAYSETGSGLYIRVYEINAQFSLWIGGGSTDGSPMYIRLVSKATPDDHIDIRRENVTDFISANRLEEATADALDALISTAILEHNKGKYLAGDFACESHVLLANGAGGPAGENTVDTAVFYLMVAYREYIFENGKPEAVSGGLIPTALTFDVNEGGEYTLKEYWEPRDGSFYSGDVREKFPGSAAEDAMDAQRYADKLHRECDEKAAASYLSSEQTWLSGMKDGSVFS